MNQAGNLSITMKKLKVNQDCLISLKTANE